MTLITSAGLTKKHSFIQGKEYYSRVLGLYGFTFVDFGANFVCFDTNGEQTKPCLVSGISQDERGLVILHEDKRHPFYDGDYVTFKEV